MSTTILWLRQDLRLTDNPALEAARHSDRLIPIYIHDPRLHDRWPPGAASRWWLHHSLRRLDAGFRELGSRLVLSKGLSEEVLRRLARDHGVERICWNRRYEPALIDADGALKAALQGDGLEVESFNAGLLFEPWEVLREAGGGQRAPYKVFTAYWRACLRHGLPGVRCERPGRLPALPEGVAGEELEALGLLPQVPWDSGLRERWRPGEEGALQQLEGFLDGPVLEYADDRDRPAVAGTSALSAHLHFGEIGPRQVAQAALWVLDQGSEGAAPASVDTFLSEIGWREFAHHLLFHFPKTDSEPLNPRFAEFAWRDDYAADLAAWQQGRTGIPLVDAGMRELWSTGWMHNRVRMVAASLLTKNLLIPWQEGAAWFWDTLVDADLANNSMGWQWVAGCGADAAPYFRIFNPVLQGEKFDPYGAYVRRWVPELKDLPARHIHKPRAARSSDVPEAYPPPLVDLKATRERALAAYRKI